MALRGFGRTLVSRLKKSYIVPALPCTPSVRSSVACLPLLRVPFPAYLEPPGPSAFVRVSWFSAGLAEAITAEPKAVVYRLDIVTGLVRGAGTQAPANVKLIGSRGESEEFLLGDDPDDVGFGQGTQQTYELEVGRDLGDLKRLYVQQVEPSTSQLGSGWYLEKVQVTGPDGEGWSFPCQAWLGKSDAGDYSGCHERNLIPCAAVDLQERIQEEYLAKPLVCNASAISIPHPEKVQGSSGKAVNRKEIGYGGEDAYFCAQGPKNGIYGLGVADGVYMWKTQGINSGLLSRTLMEASCTAVKQGKIDTLKVLQAAERRIKVEGLQGSSTACVVLIDTNKGRLSSATLGDSGFLVVGSTPDNRDTHVKFRSPQQEHSFGCPYQLGHQASADSADDAMLTTLPVMPGDMVILGSDGLWDNLGDDVILEEVQQMLAGGKRANAIALRLATLAFHNSHDKDIETPYSLGASEAFDMVYSGGKKDDITVVAAHLQ